MDCYDCKAKSVCAAVVQPGSVLCLMNRMRYCGTHAEEEPRRQQGDYCQYCGHRLREIGREIAYKDMQVDHFLPLRAWGIEDAGTNDISNLMPACRMCNHYKRANTLETFRRYIAEIPRKLREDYIYKVGVVYGNIVENEKPIVFFFEKEGEAK